MTPTTPSDKGASMIRVYDTNALWRHDEIIRILVKKYFDKAEKKGGKRK